MKIVLISDWHSENMGYSDNFMPKALASLGHEVHLVTSNGQVYFNSPSYKDIFEPFLGPRFVKCGIKKVDGYTLHRLPYMEYRGRVRIRGLFAKLRSLRPDVVQAGEFICISTYETALAKPILGYKLFVECHVHASVFPLALRRGNMKERLKLAIYKSTAGRLVNYMCEKCFPISSDAADVAIRFLGMQKDKVTVRPLGVDTSFFKPISDESSKNERSQIRKKFGFKEEDVVCIYTGRIDKSKDPLCLAKAIGRLVEQGKPFRGLFVGNGLQGNVDAIKECPGCTVHAFVPTKELVSFYRASDVGVWPKQESTSQLDAAACGLPLILSNRVEVKERINGNGVLYEEGNADDLVSKLQSLSSPECRKKMGESGARKMQNSFSWECIAKEYVKDYETSLC